MRQFVRPEVDSRAALVTLMDARGALYQLRVRTLGLLRGHTQVAAGTSCDVSCSCCSCLVASHGTELLCKPERILCAE